jgi:hypothetical protein
VDFSEQTNQLFALSGVSFGIEYMDKFAQRKDISPEKVWLEGLSALFL